MNYRPFRPEIIVETVRAVMGIRPTDFTGSGRHPTVVLARMLCVWYLRHLTARSYPEIAVIMVRTSHSTCIAQYRRACVLMESGYGSVHNLAGLGPLSFGELVNTIDRRLHSVRQEHEAADAEHERIIIGIRLENERVLNYLTHQS